MALHVPESDLIVALERKEDSDDREIDSSYVYPYLNCDEDLAGVVPGLDGEVPDAGLARVVELDDGQVEAEVPANQFPGRRSADGPRLVGGDAQCCLQT